MKKNRQFFGAVFVALVMLQGCASLGYPDIETTREGIVIATAEVRAANSLLRDLVDRNAISDADARSVLDELREASAHLRLANEAVTLAGDPAAASGNLERARVALRVALTILSRE